MPAEPTPKRTIAFIDGQNLFHNARNAFGYNFPNYDVQKLAQAVCATRGWTLAGVKFYTGVPSASDNPFWNGFWSNKLAMMGRRGIEVYSRPLVYRHKTIAVPGFGNHTFLSGEEKGIDVRLALDALDSAHRYEFDVALIFSQDQDLSELASLIRFVASFQNRWIKIRRASHQPAQRRRSQRDDEAQQHDDSKRCFRRRQVVGSCGIRLVLPIRQRRPARLQSRCRRNQDDNLRTNAAGRFAVSVSVGPFDIHRTKKTSVRNLTDVGTSEFNSPNLAPSV